MSVFDLQTYDDGDQLCSLLDSTNKLNTSSSRSNDSGLGVDESPETPHYTDDVDGAAAAHPVTTTKDEMFLSEPSSMHNVAAVNNDYVPLDDIVSSKSTSPVLSPVMSPTGYVTAWTYNEGKTVLPLNSVDEHLSLQAQSTTHDVQHLATSNVYTSCHADTASTPTRQNYLMTGGNSRVLYSDDEHGSLPQRHSRDEHVNQ